MPVQKRREIVSSTDQWQTLIRDSHPGYITWETYMENLKRLEENRTNRDALSTKGAPRRGQALLQGVALCGRCGRRMNTYYEGKDRPFYECRSLSEEQRTCWSAIGANIDQKVVEIFLESFAPSEIDLSFAVFKEVERQAVAVDRQWKLRLERARYDADRAARQYDAVEPENRVVARTLESRWNAKLEALQQIEREYEEARRGHKLEVTENDKKKIRALARDLPKLWHAKTTTNAERKQILRLLIQDVVLTPVDVPERATKIGLLWRTGEVTEVFAARPRFPWKTSEEAVEIVRELAAQRAADVEIAEELNRRGLKSATGRAFTRQGVTMIRGSFGINAGRAPGGHLGTPERDHRGRYSIRGLIARYDVTVHVVRYWIRTGVITPEPERGAFWFTLTPELHARIRKAIRNGYGPRGRKRGGPKPTEHSHARDFKAGQLKKR